MPDDLARALEAAGARGAWDAYPPSLRRGVLERIQMARTAPTRAKRVAEAARAAGLGERPAPFSRRA